MNSYNPKTTSKQFHVKGVYGDWFGPNALKALVFIALMKGQAVTFRAVLRGIGLENCNPSYANAIINRLKKHGLIKLSQKESGRAKEGTITINCLIEMDPSWVEAATSRQRSNK